MIVTVGMARSTGSGRGLEMKDGKHVVLYVEDDPDLLAAPGIVFETNGYMMLEAPSAEEGLRVYK